MFADCLAHNPIKAQAPQDLGLLGSCGFNMGVKSILAPFVRQAGKWSRATAWRAMTWDRWLASGANIP